VHKVDDMSESLGQTSNMSEEASAIGPQDEDHTKEDIVSDSERPTVAPSFGRQDDSWLSSRKRRLRKEPGGVEPFN